MLSFHSFFRENSSGSFLKTNFVLETLPETALICFFLIQGAVRLHTQVIRLFDHFKLVFANFQFFKHSGKNCCLGGKCPVFGVTINSLIQRSQIVRLVAKAGIIRKHLYSLILDSLWEMFWKRRGQTNEPCETPTSLSPILESTPLTYKTVSGWKGRV